MSPSKKYEILDHTADMGIRVFGRTLPDLFFNAGTALLDLIGKPKNQAEGDNILLTLTEEDDAALLVTWLRELLYLFNGKEIIVTRIEILSLENRVLSTRLNGQAVDFDTFDSEYDIKAVTYHQARVQQGEKGYEAMIVFDL